jgi:hypothetical protein
MRVQCEHCESFVQVERLSTIDGGVGFHCAACGAANRVGVTSAPAPAAETDVAVAPGVVVPALQLCPKCGHLQDDDFACHRCGLVFSRFDGAAADPLAGHPAADAIRARWERLRDDLDDEPGHHAFIQMCVEQSLLDYAGACYRRLTPPGALEDPRVANYRERVVKAALVRIAQVEGRRTEQLGSRLRGLVVLTFVAFLFLAFAVGYYLLTKSQTNAAF